MLGRRRDDAFASGRAAPRLEIADSRSEAGRINAKYRGFHAEPPRSRGASTVSRRTPAAPPNDAIHAATPAAHEIRRSLFSVDGA
jgi:hypothetical protein